MAQLYSLTRNPETIIGMQLTNAADMQFVQNWCEGKDYACYVNIGQDNVWSMIITTPAGVTMPAYINDWIVLKNDVQLSIVPASQGAALYTIGSPI